MAKLDIDRIISEYYMLKTVLNNKYAMDVISGKVQPAGPSAAADKKTLQAMQRYVKTLGETVIPGNGLSASETLDSYVERLMKNFKASELAKPESKRLPYSDNPFEETFRPYVSTVLSKDNAKTKIESAIRSNSSTLDSVNSLVINLGGKKQSSYVRLLSQSTELFSTVSGLRNRIATLEGQKKADATEIERLKRELAAKTKEAQNYKELCEKAIEEIGDNVTYTIMVGMLRQTSDGLEGIIRSEAQKTRQHVTEQTDRVVDLLTAKDKIKSYMFEQGKKTYPRFFVVFQNEAPLNNKGMENLYREIVDAAKHVNIPASHPAVDSLFNDMREQRLKNDNTKSNTVVVANGGKKKNTGVKVLTAALVLAVVGGGFLGYRAHTLNQQNQQLTQENQQLENDLNDVTNAFDDTFKGEYVQYQERENNQYDEYVSKVQIAVADGTLVSLPGVTPTPGQTNGEVWDLGSLNMLIEKYGQDDMLKADLSGTLDGVNWARTTEMRTYTDNIVNQIRANYYETNYNVLVGEVANLTGQVNDLTNQLNNANALNATLQAQNSALQGENQQLKDQINDLNSVIADLQAQVQSLQAQLDSVNAILDAANQQNSDLANQVASLTQQLNDANATIADLQSQVDSLSAENAQLRQEVANLKSQIAGMESEIDSLNDKITVLENDNKALATEKAELINQVNDLKDKVAQLEKQIAEMGDVDNLYQEKAELEQKVAELENRVSELESTNEQLTDKLVQYENTIDKLEQDVKDLTEALNNANADNAKLQETIDNLTKDLAQARSDYNDLYEQYQKLLSGEAESEEILQLQEKLNEAYAQITAYEQGIVDLYTGITKDNSNPDAQKAMEDLFKMFGINYSESDSPSNDNSEYQPSR